MNIQVVAIAKDCTYPRHLALLPKSTTPNIKNKIEILKNENFDHILNYSDKDVINNCDNNDNKNYDGNILSTFMNDMSIIWFEYKKGEENNSDHDVQKHDNFDKYKNNANDNINETISRDNNMEEVLYLCISNLDMKIKFNVQIGVNIPGIVENIIKINKLNCVVYWYNEHEYVSLFNMVSLECLSTNQLDTSRGLHDTNSKNKNLNNINKNEKKLFLNKNIDKTLGICRAPPLDINNSTAYNGSFFHIFNGHSRGIDVYIYIYMEFFYLSICICICILEDA
jgi:hypothetical protein